MSLEKIISGGQTGADLAALEIATELLIPTGGIAPKGYRTEYGPNLELRDLYFLDEDSSSDYKPRTKKNVANSDGTIIFGKMSGGSMETKFFCDTLKKPYLINPSPMDLRAWLTTHQIRILNIAGNRASKNRQIEKLVKDTLRAALSSSTAPKISPRV